MNLIDREKQIPEEFKDLAKEFADKGFITTSMDNLINCVEAILLSSGRPVKISEIRELIRLMDQQAELADIKKAIIDLDKRFTDSALQIVEVASGYRLQIKNEYSRLLLPMWQDNSSKTSKALMETLTIIAYKQPITRGEIESIRGVSVSTQIIRNLTERNWIKVSGYKDVPGRPALYKTTKEFLKCSEQSLFSPLLLLL